MIRTIIIDDEPLARSRIERLLGSMDNVDVVATGENGQQAIDLVQAKAVDLILMDINMPVKNGLDAAKEIVENHSQAPAIIFCTAYDEYALQAFEASATSYLLKPVEQAQLEQAVEKAASLSQLQLRSLIDANQTDSVSHLAIQHKGFVENHSLEQILYFRAESKHVVAGLIEGKEVVVDQTLTKLESELERYFIRVHRNTLVSRQHVLKLTRNSNGHAFVELSGHVQPFAVSRRHLAGVKKCFQ